MSLILLYLVTGLLAGLLAGLFGIGGGLIIVPLLLISFRIQGLPEAVSTHLAIGTSLASIGITGIAAILARRAFSDEIVTGRNVRTSCWFMAKMRG